MTEAVVRVTSQGQATIPAELRQKYGIRAPGLVRFFERGGHIAVEPIASADEMMGVLSDAPFSSADVVREREADLAAEKKRLGRFL